MGTGCFTPGTLLEDQLACEESLNNSPGKDYRLYDRIQAIIKETKNMNDFVERMIKNETNDKPPDDAILAQKSESCSFTSERICKRENTCFGTDSWMPMQDIEVLEVQIRSLMDKLVEMQMRTSMQLMEERLRNMTTISDMELKHELSLKAKEEEVMPQIYRTSSNERYENDPRIIEKLRASLRKVNELETKQNSMKRKYDSKVELLNKRIQHYLNEKLQTEKQLNGLTEAYKVKEETMKELKEAKIDGYELQIMKLEVARNQDKLEMKNLRKQCKELLEEKALLEPELNSLRTKNECLVAQMNSVQNRLSVDLNIQREYQRELSSNTKELAERAEKFRRKAEKEKAVAEVTKEMYVKLRAVQVGYRIKLQELSANMRYLVKELMTSNVNLANLVQGWLQQLTTEVKKKEELVWFKGDLSEEEFVEWAKMVGVFISRDHLTLAFHMVADPVTKRISCSKLRSTLSSDLEINSALKILLKDSGKVRFEEESKIIPSSLLELLQSTQFFMELSVLLNNHKQYKQMKVLFLRHINEISIKSIVEHLQLEVNILIHVIQGGNPYEAKVSLWDDDFMHQSEQLYIGLSKFLADGKIGLKMKIYEKDGTLIIGQLQAIQRKLDELLSNLDPGKKWMKAKIIKTIEHQTQELVEKTSGVTPSFSGLGFVVVQRVSKLSELVSRLKFADVEVIDNSSKHELYCYSSSCYHLVEETYNELIHQLFSAKQSLALYFESVDEAEKVNDPNSYRVLGRGSQSDEDLEQAEIFREVESRINALRTKLKSPPGHKRPGKYDNSLVTIGGLSSTPHRSDVKLLSVETNIERAFKILSDMKIRATHPSPMASKSKISLYEIEALDF